MLMAADLRLATPGANPNYIGARNLPAMRDIKFLITFQKALTEFLLPAGRSGPAPRPARGVARLNADFLACGDTVLAQSRQAAYWGAIARVSRLRS
jgi:hypothetical protein